MVGYLLNCPDEVAAMRNMVLACFGILFCLILISSCSKKDFPILPEDGKQGISSINSLPPGVTDTFPDGTPSAGMGALGLFNLHINPSPLSAELTSLRNAALTDVLEAVDITNFLRLAPCSNCARIKTVSLDADGNIVVGIGIKHPFPIGDPMKPITGRNRADLHVCNVEGIVVSNILGTTFAGLGSTIAGFRLLNADGYTGYLDGVLDEIYPTDATIHPYITHFDDYTRGNFDPSNPMGFASVTDPPPGGNLVMAMGSDYNFQDYVFEIDPAKPVDFIYAVGCAYGLSSQNMNARFTPEYRIPQHNKKASSEVRVEIISNNLKGNDIASTAQIQVKIVDISHGVAVGTGLDQMLSDSSVNDIFVDIPGVTADMLVLDGNSPSSGIGHDPADPLVYDATVTNTAGAIEGTYMSLVKVTDNYMPGQNTTLFLNGNDGIKRVDPTANPVTGIFAITEFATYAVFTIDVSAGNIPPVAILLTNPDPADISQFQTVAFDATTSHDPDGTISLYEFDFDWDGIQANFTADSSNITGLAVSPPYVTAGIYTAGLRATDNLGAVGYDSVTVTVSQVQMIIYVDDSYAGSTHNGTMSEPYITIQDGLAAASSGFQVWVDDSGTNYIGPVTLVSGVILKSVNWDPIDGGSMAAIDFTGNNSAVVNGADNAAIDGFKITGGGYVNTTGQLGIRIQNVSSTVRNCRIQLANVAWTMYGIVVENSTGSLIDNCEIDSFGSTNSYNYVWGIYLNNSPITIQKCYIHDISVFDNYHYLGGIYALSCAPQSGNHLILKQNKISNLTSSGLLGGSYCNAFGILVSASNEADVYNNLINTVYTGNYDYSDPPGGTHGMCFMDSADVQMVNNTIYDIHKVNYFGLIYGVKISNCTNFDGRNNIVNNIKKDQHIMTAYGVSAPSGTLWEYCDVYDVSNGLYVDGIAAGTGCISSDPAFVIPGTNFHLQTGSPCINTGDPSITDPDSSRSDMGCYGGPGGNW